MGCPALLLWVTVLCSGVAWSKTWLCWQQGLGARLCFKEMCVDQTLSTLGECSRPEKDGILGNWKEKTEACVKPSAEVLS